MPDPAEGRATFRDALRRAEESAGITRDDAGNEVIASETPADPNVELPGAVPVQASDQPLTPEPVTPSVETTTTDTSEQQQPQQALTVEQLQAQIAERDARIEEQKQMIGRQSAEVGEVRQEIAALRDTVEQSQAQPAPQAQGAPVTQFDIDNDPGEATLRAFHQRDQGAVERAFDAWKVEDPIVAGQWLTDKKLEAQAAAHKAELDELRAEVKTVAENDAEATVNDEWADAFTQTITARPDFLQHATRLLEEVAPKFPHIVSVLSTGDAEAKREVLVVLYDLDRAARPEEVRGELEQAAAEAAAEEAAARAGAASVTRQTEAGQSSVEKTNEQLEQEGYLQRQKAKPSLAGGWTGRS